MKLTHSLILDQKGLKQLRKNEVVSAALMVFGTQGIEATTMVDVAKAAEVGVASVYRYHKTKFDLALAAAIYLWEDQINPDLLAVIDEDYPSLSGLDQAMRFMKVMTQMIKERPLALRYLEYFDNFVVSQAIDPNRLIDYEAVVGSAKPVFMAALVKGKEDGSIRQDLDEEAFYQTITHTLMSLSQKLILRGVVIDSDESVGKSQQVELVIEMAKTYIKNPLR